MLYFQSLTQIGLMVSLVLAWHDLDALSVVACGELGLVTRLMLLRIEVLKLLMSEVLGRIFTLSLRWLRA